MALSARSTGTTRAAARAATSRPIRAIRTLFSVGGGQVTRFDRLSKQEQDITLAGGQLGPRRRRSAVPLQMDPADSHFAARSECDLHHRGARVQDYHEARAGPISPDLTRNDKSKQIASGGPLTKDNTSVEYYDTMFALAESPVQKGCCGRNATMASSTSRERRRALAERDAEGDAGMGPVSMIEPSPHDAGAAYAAVDRHKLDDSSPTFSKRRISARRGRKIANGIPDGAYIHAVREDPGARGTAVRGHGEGSLRSPSTMARTGRGCN